jgi:uncharacterized protein
MWLVVGGPVVVVVAGIATAVIAVNGADPVLNKADYERDLQQQRALQATTGQDDLNPLLPAQQARNHVVTPAESVPIPKQP